MAVVFSPNIIEIAVLQTHANRPSVNVWHMWFDSELGSDTKEAVVLDFANNWQDHIMQFLVAEQVLIGFEWRSLDPNDATVGSLDPNPAKNTTGQQTNTAMPPNVAYLVHKNTDSRPRGRRDGLAFLSGVSETWVSPAGVVAPANVTTVNGRLDDFYNGVSDTSGAPSGDRYPAVLETTPASRAPGTAQVTIASRRVTSLSLDTLVSTQRDRLR